VTILNVFNGPICRIIWFGDPPPLLARAAALPFSNLLSVLVLVVVGGGSVRRYSRLSSSTK
jgi:hypothetical protein